ncbi:unnamed protein product [Caenorhabditis angaria]|uniref:AMP-dependent synthetase/ligase domain-containing protein n=1 Tax=Caenorhabditis angaria TaxID=860376 RepID=A0A9P1MT41_9PELO|nr:unnamed protein product [Caenorhabditis angaria]
MSFATEFTSKCLENSGIAAKSLSGEQTLFSKFVEESKKYSVFCEKYSVIATFCTNSVGFLEFVIGSQIAGIKLVPLNPSYKAYEIEEYLKITNPSHIILSKDVDSTKFKNYDFTFIEDIVITDYSKSGKDYKNSGKIIFFSSGTTGPPKPFIYDSRILLAHLQQFELIQKSPKYYSPSSTDICFGVLPYFHAGGLITVLSMLWIGCTVIINERWDGKEFIDTCNKYQVSVLFLVPPVLKFLANAEYEDLKNLKTIYVGAAASEKSDFEKVAKRFSSLENLIQLYGLTECGVLISSTVKGISNGENVGIPFPLVEIKLDSNNQILVKSPTSTIREDQFMETGDLGIFIGEQQELKIIGRSKEMIKVRGWQVNPNEIEEFVKCHLNIDCAVYQNSDQKLLMKVVGKEDKSLKNKILKMIKENFASYKSIENVLFCSELPRNASGKLMRRFL